MKAENRIGTTKKKETRDKQETNNKMVNLNPTISIVTLNRNGISISIKGTDSQNG